jgi:LysM repeat protein
VGEARAGTAEPPTVSAQRWPHFSKRPGGIPALLRGDDVVTQQDALFNQLKQKYQSVLDLNQQSGVKLAHLHVQDSKLFMQGEAPSEEIKNKVWDQIKRIDPTYSDLVCDLKINPSLAQPVQAAANNGAQTYTVMAGDSLSKISKQIYGDANQYMKIFDANRDQLKDPNLIHPGQKLQIPAK